MLLRHSLYVVMTMMLASSASHASDNSADQAANQKAIAPTEQARDQAAADTASPSLTPAARDAGWERWLAKGQQYYLSQLKAGKGFKRAEIEQ